MEAWDLFNSIEYIYIFLFNHFLWSMVSSMLGLVSVYLCTGPSGGFKWGRYIRILSTASVVLLFMLDYLKFEGPFSIYFFIARGWFRGWSSCAGIGRKEVLGYYSKTLKFPESDAEKAEARGSTVTLKKVLFLVLVLIVWIPIHLSIIAMSKLLILPMVNTITGFLLSEGFVLLGSAFYVIISTLCTVFWWKLLFGILIPKGKKK